jgi:hypothetical protein
MRYRLILLGFLAFATACAAGGKPVSLARYGSSSVADIKYPGSGTELAPPPSTSAAATYRTTPDQAMQTYKKSGVFPGVASKAVGPPDVSLVSFSDNEQGDVQPDGSIKLKFQHVLSWAIVYHGVPWAGIGGGPAPAPGGQTVLPSPVPEDIVIIIDANSGQLVSAFADVPGTDISQTPVASAKGVPSTSQKPTQAPSP